MKIVMDSDCLVKLVKAGGKEVVAEAMEVHIPKLVRKETVDDVRERGFPDALVIEENIDKKMLQVIESQSRKRITALPAAKGETEVVSLFLDGGYDAIASDDRRFLRKLGSADIPFLTPTACLVYACEQGKTGKDDTLRILENLKSLISGEEYAVAKIYLEEIS